MPSLRSALITLLLACPTTTLQASVESPPCPITASQIQAPSAGCLSLLNGHLLVIKANDGKISIPGGSVDAGESAQCGAHRETWEETGLNVTPQRLLRVFANGFHLYLCQPPSNSDLAQRLSPPFWLEVRQAFWLKPEEFDDYRWRFPKQKQWFVEWIDQHAKAD